MKNVYKHNLEEIPTIKEAYENTHLLLSRTDVLCVLSNFIVDDNLTISERLKAIDLFCRLGDGKEFEPEQKEVNVLVNYCESE